MTSENAYQLRDYRASDLDAVAELQRFLLGPDIAANRAYLEWKYHRNPLDPEARAIVAVADGTVVGFRGHVPSLWWDGDTGRDVPLLALADTCVHGDHRRRGLFSRMTAASIDAFADLPYRAIINLSTSARPAPGYLKLGWRTFGHHGHLVRYSRAGACSKVRALLGLPRPPLRPVDPATGADWACDDTARPADMARIVAAAGSRAGRFCLARDAAFYAWRYENPRERYRFAWSLGPGDASPDGFIVLRLGSDGREGNIVDHAECRPGRVSMLADRLLADRHVDDLSVWNAAPRGADERFWRNLGFISLRRVRRLIKPSQAPMPLLIRPLVREPAEQDWIVAKHDLRRIDSWHLLEICSDGA